MLLFTSSKRGRFAIFLVVVAILAPVAVLSGGSDQSLGSVMVGSAMSLLFAVLLLLRDFKYMRTATDDLWRRWDSCREAEPQRIRMERAGSGKLTVKNIDKNARVAAFVGGRGEKYRTTLISCTCPDFKEREVPCKHMYKLASDLGIRELPDPLYEEYEATVE